MDAATRDTITALKARRVQLLSEMNTLMDKHDGELPDSVKREYLKNIHESWMAGLHIRYLRTNNALYLWLAYYESRRHDMEAPKWFYGYLDDAVRALADAVDLPRKRGLEWHSLVAGAFGLDDARKRTSFRKSSGDFIPRELDQDTMKRLKTDSWAHLPPAQRNCVYVLRYVEQGMTREQALSAAHKESGVPIGTLERDYDRHKGITLQK